MPNCVYNTDPEWLAYLKSKGHKDSLNFWRKDQRKLKLNAGEYFYFKLRGTPFIAGRAKYARMHLLTIEEAWRTYEGRNGVGSYVEFVSNINRVLNMDELANTRLNCIELYDAEWLDEELYYEVSKDFFPPQILAMKFYEDHEVEEIAKLFNSQQQFSHKLNEQDEIFTVNHKNYQEGKVRFAIHKRRERNKSLVESAKKDRKWLCDICGMKFKDIYGVDYIEAHHKKPLSHNEGIVSNMEMDLILLCPNCHKAVHKYMALDFSSTYEDIKNKISKMLSQ